MTLTRKILLLITTRPTPAPENLIYCPPKMLHGIPTPVPENLIYCPPKMLHGFEPRSLTAKSRVRTLAPENLIYCPPKMLHGLHKDE